MLHRASSTPALPVTSAKVPSPLLWYRTLPPDVCHVQIEKPVVVIVAGRCPHAVADVTYARALGHIDEVQRPGGVKTANTSTDQTQTDNFKAVARYVKITVTGLESGVWASFYDFKVLGEQWNLAMGKTASSDSTMSGFPASNAADGNQTTRWSANDGNTGHYVKVDLGYVKKITNGTQVLWPSGSAYQYKVETSIDNTNWTQSR